MGLVDTMKRDLIGFTTNKSDFGQTLIFQDLSSPANVATVAGYAKNISIKYDEMGMLIKNSKNATCTVAEQVLMDAGYPTRNGRGEINLINNLVYIRDANKNLITFSINEVRPNENKGLIVCILSYYG